MDEVIARVEAGERPSVAEIKERVEGARREAQRAAEDAKLTPRQRQAKARRQAGAERKQQAYEQEHAERTDAANAALTVLVDCLDDRIGEFAALLEKADHLHVLHFLRNPARLAALRSETAAQKTSPAAIDLDNDAEPKNNAEPPLPFMNGADQPSAPAPAS